MTPRDLRYYDKCIVAIDCLGKLMILKGIAIYYSQYGLIFKGV